MVSIPRGIKIVLLDLDGTIHLGGIPIPGAVHFIQRCHENEIKTIFLSNNSSKSVNEYLTKLNSMGINAVADDILLSTHDCIHWLKDKKWTKVYCLGTKSMKEMLEENGIKCLERGVDCVVLGYDTELTYEKLSKATSLIHQNIPLVATHPDIVCPSPNGNLPDVGAILKMIELTTGVEPTIITGKPRAEMILGRLKIEGVEPSEVAMIGDRLYTDMEMARVSGVVSVLVLSGEATQEDVDNYPWTPDFVFNSVNDIDFIRRET